MSRRLAAIVGAWVVFGALAAPALAEIGPTLTEPVALPKFPARSFLLSLPDRQALTAKNLEVTENGAPVRGLTVASSAVAGSAIVLAVDASLSMRGEAIVDAMDAARAFATRRRPDQKIGVVLFSDEPRVALEPTTDQLRIDSALAATPALSSGTQVYDATQESLDLLARAKAGAGSIIVLSDGADTGSAALPGGVARSARDRRVRIYAIGLRSKRFDPGGLKAMAAAGEYQGAKSSKELQPIFDSLGRRISSEYFITYQSQSPLDTRVAVTARVVDVDRSAVLAYETPHLDVRVYRPDRASGSAWASATTLSLAFAVVALLILIACFTLFRPRPKTVSERVEGFVGSGVEPSLARTAATAPTPVLQRVDARLDRVARWQRFKLDLELTGVHIPPIRVLLFTLTGTLALMAVLAVVLGRPMTALFALLIPFGGRACVHFRAERVRRAFGEQLPDNLQVLAAALRAGHSFTGGLKVMCDDAAEPSQSEFGRVVGDDQLGVSVEESLNVVGERMRNEDVGYIGLIATIQRDTGGNTAEVLDRVTGTIRERAQLRRMIRTLTAQGRLGGWIVTLLPVGLVAFITLMQPDYLEPMLESPVGRMALGLGVVCLGIGGVAIRRIVDIKV
jgi:tight adherence protein B